MKKYLVRMAAAGRTESTITNCRRVLGYFREYLRARGLEEDIRKVETHLLSQYRKHVLSKEEWSMNYRIEMLHTVFNLFHDLTNEGVLFIDPASGVKLPRISRRRLPVYLGCRELEKLLSSSLANTPAGLRDRAVLETLYSTGIRAAEC